MAGEDGELLGLDGALGVDGEDRLKLINLVAEITATDFAGYQAVLAIHAEGSIEAEKLTIFASHDARASVEYAKRLAGIGD